MEASERPADHPPEPALVLLEDKSGKLASKRCPTPVVGRAFLLASGEPIPIPCGRNSCGVCRRRNVKVTAHMFALSASADPTPPTHALTTTTQRWLTSGELRETTHQFAARVRREVAPTFQYAWVREWSTGRAATSGGVRRTHYHWLLKGLDADAIARTTRLASEVWKRRSGAWRVQTKPLWDVGGFGRYMAGLVRHHLKEEQRPPEGWRGRRTGTSQRFYSLPAAELRARAVALTRDDSLIGRLERSVCDEVLGDCTVLDDAIYDEYVLPLLRDEYDRALRQPAPVVVRVSAQFWDSERAA